MQNLIERFQKTLSYIELAGIIITLFLLPLDRFPYLHHVPFSLGFISLIFLLIAALWRTSLVIKEHRYKDLRRYVLIGGLLALPVVAYAQSYFYAIDRAYTLSATKLLLAVCLRAFFIFLLVSETPSLWRIVKKTIYVTSFLVVAFGFFQFFLDVFGASQHITDLKGCCTSNSTYVFPRVHSTALEPLYLDHYLMLPIWLITLDFWQNKSTRKNKRLVLLLIACATLFILTVARSATFGLIIAGLVFYLGARKSNQARSYIRFMAKVWGTSLITALVLVAFSGLVAIFIPKNAINGSRSGLGSVGLFGSHAVSIDDGSARTRYDLWPKSIPFIKEKPLQGVGAYNSRIRLNLDKYNKTHNPVALQPFNNDLIGLLVDLGLIGVVAFAPLLVVLGVLIYKMFVKRWSGEAAAFAVILIGMLVQSNFFHSILLTRLWVVVGLLLTQLYKPAKAVKG